VPTPPCRFMYALYTLVVLNRLLSASCSVIPHCACIHKSADLLSLPPLGAWLRSYIGTLITGKIVSGELFLMRISLVGGLRPRQDRSGSGGSCCCAAAVAAKPKKNGNNKDVRTHFIGMPLRWSLFCNIPARRYSVSQAASASGAAAFARGIHAALRRAGVEFICPDCTTTFNPSDRGDQTSTSAARRRGGSKAVPCYDNAPRLSLARAPARGSSWAHRILALSNGN